VVHVKTTTRVFLCPEIMGGLRIDKEI